MSISRVAHRALAALLTTAVITTAAISMPTASATAAPSAVTQTFSYTGATQTFTVPAGVTQLAVSLTGAEGGQGGRDGVIGTPGGYKGQVTGTIAVEPGQVLTIAVGGGGANGAGCTNAQTRAAAGFSPLSGYAGGRGGMPGNRGCSGGGGGGGAATVLLTGTATIVAGGAGGGGGSGQWAVLVGRQAEATHIARADTTSGIGQNGYDVMSICSGNCDGGGGGAGGGGAQGGAQGGVEFGTGTYTEWLGYGGRPGSNSTAGLAGLSASYVYFGGNGGHGSVSLTYSTGSADAPTSVIGATGDEQIALSWTAPVNEGGATVTDYVIGYAENSATPDWQIVEDGESTATSALVSGLTNGTAYIFRVAAVNSFGTSAPSAASDPVFASGVPGAPSITSVISRDAALTVAFDAASSPIAIERYEYQLDGGLWVATADADSPLLVSGLSNGTTYEVRVRGVNAIGAGAASDAVSGMAISTPGAPTIDVVSPTVGGASIEFTPGFGGGGAITGYEYRVDGGSWIDAGATSPVSIVGLDDGASSVIELRALNSAGAGSPSAPVTVTTPAIPGAPVIGEIVPADESLRVAFGAAPDGGSAVTDYEYQLEAGGDWTPLPTTASPVTITGLVNGTSYEVRLRAINAVGTGAPSSAVSGAPATTPSAPSIVGDTVAGSDATLSAQFTAPDSDGGSAITTYEYSTDGGATWRARDAGTTESPLVITTLSSDGATSLTNGTTYYVEVRAVNAQGSGTASGVAEGIARTTPSAPAIASITPGSTELRVRFDAASNGGSPITAYEYRVDDGAWVSTGGLGTAFSIAGLTNGTEYLVTVRAVNSVGVGPSSEPVAATPVALPGQPTIVSFLPTDRTLTLTVDLADDGGTAVIGWQYSTDAGVTWALAGAESSPFSITSISSDVDARLVNGENYAITVRAINAAGVGAASAPRILTPRAVPAQPVTSLTALNGAVSVAFSVADDGGSPVLDLQYSLNGAAFISTGTLSTPFVLTGLTNGQPATIELRAVNVSGPSAVSDARSATPRTVPGAPTAVSAVSGNAQALVSWSAPASTGGASITQYTASAYATASSSTVLASCSTAGAGCAITGLSNDTTYFVSVVAENSAGAGLASTPRVSVLPLAKPGAPSLGTVTPANTFLSAAFTPGAAGSRTITGYEYQLNGGEWRAASGTASPILISGLTNGTAYTVALRAVSAAGAGESSNTRTATPFALPSTPDSATIIAEPASGSAIVSWDAPNSNGAAITGYTVVAWSAATQGSQVRTCTTSGATSCTITGLSNGTTYYITIDATNAAGTSTRSTPRVPVVYTGKPGSVSGVTAVAGDAQASLTWNAGAAGASAVSDYTVWYRAVGDSDYTRFDEPVSTDRSATVTGLTNGTEYTFIVYAVNAQGTSLASAPSAAVSPTGIGVAPTFAAPVRTPDGFTVAISNYSEVTTYTATATNGASANVSGSTVTVSGLAANAESTVTVNAVRHGYTTAAASTSGTSLEAGVAPVLGEPISIDGGFTVQIDNLDALAVYVFALPGDATATLEGTTVTVAGLAPGESAELTVTAQRAGRADAPTTVTGEALPAAPSPQLGDGTRTADGFTVPLVDAVEGVDYTVSSTEGVAALGDGVIVVTGLAPEQEATLTVTASLDAHVDASTSVTSSALGTGIAPALTLGDRTPVGFSATIDNPQDGVDYLVSTTAGSAVLSGSTITVTGLAPSQNATVTVVAVAAGRTDAPSSVTSSALGQGAIDPAAPVPTLDGFRAEIQDFDAEATYEVTTSAGVVVLEGATIVVTGLTPGESATVTVSFTKEGETDAVVEVTSAPLAIGTAPTFSTSTSAARGFTFIITNYSAEISYTLAATNAGSVTRSGATVTVAGLAPGATSAVTVTASRAGYRDAAAVTSGAALPPAPTPPPAPAPEPEESTEPSTPTPPQTTPQNPGTSTAIVDGEPRQSTVVVDGERFTVSTQGATLVVEPMSGSGSSPAGGDTTPVVVVEGDVTIEVGGFEADSEIEIWAYSTPTYLTSMTAGADFAAGTVVTLPASIRPGEHTIVVTGTGMNGEPIELSLGILVVEEGEEETAAETPAVVDDVVDATEGVDSGAGAGIAIAFSIVALLLATGLLFFLLARRRDSDKADVAAA
ncbi:MAG: fibronectin type III domain-containing protein [Microcella sp.]|uniref:beta strand repeat-containing protein n=1 Tax=Microcella sp. TaxID=1913979 RepID=UPI003315C5CE